MESVKIKLKSIKLETLNAECLLAVNRCVIHLKQHQQKSLRLQDKDVLVKLSTLVKKSNDPLLDIIYKDMKQKMVACLNTQRLDEQKSKHVNDA